MAAPQPSARFVRAVAAERAELERHRNKLAQEATTLRAALARIEHGLAEIDERCGLLDRLTDGESDVAEPSEKGAANVDETTVLRGPAIRERAVAVLVARGRDSLHYRRWFELLTGEGHVIAGKDPLAVFLTQITRSPVIRKGEKAGVYALDRHAPERLEQGLQKLQRELAATATATADIATIRARRMQLTAEIGRAERALEEAIRVLDEGSSPAALTA